jgi:hypothetical protein
MCRYKKETSEEECGILPRGWRKGESGGGKSTGRVVDLVIRARSQPHHKAWKRDETCASFGKPSASSTSQQYKFTLKEAVYQKFTN